MNIVDLIVEKAEIVDIISRYTKLSKINNGYLGKCPIHDGDGDKTIWVTESTKSYYCFSCFSAGDVIKFISEVEKISWEEAVEQLAQDLNIDIGKNEQWQQQKSEIQKNEILVEKHFKQVETVEQHLIEKRGLTKETIEEFKLGYDDDIRVKFDGKPQYFKGISIPLRDKNGRTVAFAKRPLPTSKPKYVNSWDSSLYNKSSYLFNADKARRNLKNNGVLYIVEGYFDAIVCHQQKNSVIAYAGAQTTKEHINQIKELIRFHDNVSLMLCPDNDETGQAAVSRMRDKFSHTGLDIRVVVLPSNCKDFNDVHLAGGVIRDLPSKHIDIYVLEQRLDKCLSIEHEYTEAFNYIRSVKSLMVKGDIARLLTQRWREKYKIEKDIREVREWLKVADDESLEEIMSEFHDIDSCFEDYYKIIEAKGIGLGYAGVDKSLDEVRRQEVIIEGARPGVGKTQNAIQKALFWIVVLKLRVLFFSLEMPRGALLERFIAAIMKIHPRQLKEVIKQDNQKLDIYLKVKEKLKKYLYIIDKSNLSITDIQKRIQIANQRVFEDGPVDCVIVDYFGLMKNTHDFESASESARLMKTVAKECNVVFVMLCQLRRNGADWEEPFANELKMTGDLEASADVITMLWRVHKNPELGPIDKERLKNVTYLKIEKARRGCENTLFALLFNPETTLLREAPEYLCDQQIQNGGEQVQNGGKRRKNTGN